MDKWNNQVGQEIGSHVKNQLKGMENLFNDQAIEDYIAKMVMQRMRAGDLITNPNDTRKFSDYHKIKARKEELVPNVTSSRYSTNVPIQHMKNKKGFYKGFINEENGLVDFKFSTLLNLAYTLDIPLDELFRDFKYKIFVDDN